VQTHRGFLTTKARKQRSFCAWLIIIITQGESIWRTKCSTRTCFRGKNWPYGTSNFSKDYWTLQFSTRLFFYRQVMGRIIQQLSYRIQLVEGLFTKYACATEMRCVPGWQASDNTVPRLTERHFLRKVAPKTKKSKPQRRCVVHSKHGKKKTSVYCFQKCNVGLCLEECFELYHTKLNYWGNDNCFIASI